jgi:peptidoglycan-associated lipoprotein
MQMKKLLLTLGLTVALSVLTACSSTGTGATNTTGSAGNLNGTGVQTAGLGPSAYASNGLSNPNAMVPGADQKYYFDFDQSAVHDSDMPSIKVQAQYLNSRPSASVLIEGNTDTMGSREYNIALGQRRADAVANVLKLQGVTPKQLRTISYGSEKPQVQNCSASDTSICAVDRRDDVVYQTH